MSAEQSLLSIGALSRAVGIPIETLRTWERRYGVPSAQRTRSGHRRYSLAAVEQLRLVAQVLEQGQPPSVALRMDVRALQRLLGATAQPTTIARPASATRPAPDTPAATLDHWFERVERFEGRAFERELRAGWAAFGGAAFVERLAAPFLVELGLRWQQQRLSVAHEHFASERLRDFLVQQWRPLSDAATGACFVCATPAEERHVLGLHLVALTLAMHNARVVFLGADLPAADIAEAARHHAAEAVVLSASVARDRAQLSHELAALRAALPASLPILCGGEGPWPDAQPGCVLIRRFAQLTRWATHGAASTE